MVKRLYYMTEGIIFSILRGNKEAYLKGGRNSAKGGISTTDRFLFDIFSLHFFFFFELKGLDNR